MRVIAMIGHKGGVGTTTAAVNLGHALALDGQRVVLADMDPQARLSACLGIYDQASQGVDRIRLPSNLTMSAVMAAHDVLIPVVGDYLSLTGFARLMFMLRRLQTRHGGGLKAWVFFNRFTPRRRLSQEVYATVVRHFPDRLLGSAIREAAVLAECAGAGKTLFEYRGSSRVAREFRLLADDLLNARVVENGQEETSHVA
jgi:cellulose biosynthesis protein BcsQ